MEHPVAGAVSHLHHAAGSEMNMALVGAGLLAMNDNAVHQTDRGACIASKPAPTGISAEVWNHG